MLAPLATDWLGPCRAAFPIRNMISNIRFCRSHAENVNDGAFRRKPLEASGALTYLRRQWAPFHKNDSPSAEMRIWFTLENSVYTARRHMEHKIRQGCGDLGDLPLRAEIYIGRTEFFPFWSDRAAKTNLVVRYLMLRSRFNVGGRYQGIPN